MVPKLTNQRLEILNFLESDFVRKKLPRISLGTVYRNLMQMKENGMVKVINSLDRRRFDGNKEEHQHFICTKCSEIEDIMIDASHHLKAAEMVRKQVHSAEINIYGTCTRCSKEA
jgi:Fe2+ or Zn2+ uptake regulation protein